MRQSPGNANPNSDPQSGPADTDALPDPDRNSNARVRAGNAFDAGDRLRLGRNRRPHVALPIRKVSPVTPTSLAPALEPVTPSTLEIGP